MRSYHCAATAGRSYTLTTHPCTLAAYYTNVSLTMFDDICDVHHVIDAVVENLAHCGKSQIVGTTNVARTSRLVAHS